MIWLYLHLIVILLSWLSPLLFSWQIVLIGSVMYIISGLTFNSCILTRLQFGDNRSFYQHYFHQLGFTLTRSQISLYFGRLLPISLIVLAYIWQVLLHHDPLLRL